MQSNPGWLSRSRINKGRANFNIDCLVGRLGVYINVNTNSRDEWKTICLVSRLYWTFNECFVMQTKICLTLISSFLYIFN